MPESRDPSPRWLHDVTPTPAPVELRERVLGSLPFDSKTDAPATVHAKNGNAATEARRRRDRRATMAAWWLLAASILCVVIVHRSNELMLDRWVATTPAPNSAHGWQTWKGVSRYLLWSAFVSPETGDNLIGRYQQLIQRTLGEPSRGVQ